MVIIPYCKNKKINSTKLINELKGRDINEIKNILDCLYYKKKIIPYYVYWCINLYFDL